MNLAVAYRQEASARHEASACNLSSRQRSIWLEIQTSGPLGSYQIGGFCRIEAALDVDLFRRALSLVIAGNDALRLRVDANEPIQRIDSSCEPLLEVVALPADSDPEIAFLEWARQAFATEMPLDGSPLCRFALARGGDQLWFVLIRCHHVIADGLSIPLIGRATAAAYDALQSGGGPGYGVSSYLRFCSIDADYLQSPRYDRDLDYWVARFKALPPPLLPRSNRAEPPAESKPVLWSLPRVRYDSFCEACASRRVRQLPMLIALLGSALSPPGGPNDITIGIAVSGRTKAEADVIGQFAGIVPLRFTLHDDRDFGFAAEAVAAQLGRDYRHQQLPVDALTRALDLMRHGRRTAFDVFMSFIPADKSNYDFNLAGAKVTPVILRGREPVPLAIYVTESNSGGDPLFEFAYHPDHLDEASVEAIRERLAGLIEAFSLAPMVKLGELPDLRRPVASLASIEEDSRSLASPAVWNVRIAGTFTVEPIVPALQFWMRKLSLDARVECAGYNQVFQSLLDPTSALRANPRGVNVVLLRIEDWLRDRVEPRATEIDENDVAFLRETAVSFIEALRGAAHSSSVRWIVLLMPPTPAFGREGFHNAVQAGIETLIAQALADMGGVELIHYAAVQALYPVTEEWDPRGDELGHVPYTSGCFAASGTFVARTIHRLLRRPVKVLAVDCDNTLWGGVVAEDGAAGLRIEDSHRRLQQRLVDAAGAGVLVALVSKNDWADVEAVFRERRDMILTLDHVVSRRVNWTAKSINIRDLAAELDLGLDAFVFLDDNAMEIADVEAHCPGVIAIQAPEAGADRSFFVDHLWPLDHGPTTKEDRKRTKFYRENSQREQLKRTVVDYAGFIASLKLAIKAEPPDVLSLDRCAQLTERTTQFNINGRRLSQGDLLRLRDGESSGVRCLSVSDRFGDYGLVGLIAATAEQQVLEVGAFLMSCRVLGRGVEHALINELGKLASALGCRSVRFLVHVTARNLPVRQFLGLIDAQREHLGNDIVVTMSTEAALSTRFEPAAKQVEAPTESAGATRDHDARFAPEVAGSQYGMFASEFDNIPAIERALREAVVTKRNSETPYRPPETETELVLAALVSEALGIDRLGVDDDFLGMGLQSLAAVQLVSRVRGRLGIDMPIRWLFEARTVAALARVMKHNGEATGYSAIAPLQLGIASRRPLFCFHPSGGDAVCYLRLARSLGPEQPVYGLQASGLAEGEGLAGSIEEMAAHYIQEMRRIQPIGPYRLLGWSLGGAIAYECAVRLHAMKEEIELLAFMDAPSPQFEPEGRDVTRDECIKAMGDDLVNIIDEFQLKHDGSASGIRITTIEELVKAAKRLAILPAEFSVPDAERKIDVYRNCFRLLRNWIPKPFAGGILHFRAARRRWEVVLPFEWQQWCVGPIDIVEIPCTHLRIGFEPYVGIIADRLRPLLEQGHVVPDPGRNAEAVP